jgi:hypothetical protein
MATLAAPPADRCTAGLRAASELRKEDFWPIVATEGVQMGRRYRADEETDRADRERDPPCEPVAIFRKEKFRIVHSGLRCQDSIAELCPASGYPENRLLKKAPTGVGEDGA